MIQKLVLAVFVVALACGRNIGSVEAQIIAADSGVPGDGIPDLYYFPTGGITAPNGVRSPPGTLLLDTDGSDFFVLFVADADAHFFNGCILCEGDLIPAPPPPGHVYTVGNINGYTRWIRTFPLTGPGPRGLVNLARGPTGLSEDYFARILEDPNSGEFWSFRFVSASGAEFYSNVWVPEPSSSLLMFAGLFLITKVRKQRT